MPIEEHSAPSWKEQLLTMGYTETDVTRAGEAGVVNVEHALDFLQSNPTPPAMHASQEWPTLADDMRVDYQPIPPQQPPAASSAQPNTEAFQSTGISNARNSLDRIDLTRAPPTSTPAVSAEGLQDHNQDEDLRRALELSQKEEDEREMARVLRLSKQGATAVSMDQDPELARAIEENFKENPGLDRTVSWQSQPHVNVKDRVRKSMEDPVGLRNIGNTCYLNSLLQVYYHLPDFRRAIMSFRSPRDHAPVSSGRMDDNGYEKKSETTSEPLRSGSNQNQGAPVQPGAGMQRENSISDDKSDNRSEKIGEDDVKNSAVHFVIELQRLFAAMALGNQNCVDPTAVMGAMRDSDGKPISIGAQQDASEFNQLFLETVEKGLSQDISKRSVNDADAEETLQTVELTRASGMSESPEDTVKNMFTVKFQQEIGRCHSGETGSNQETRYPMASNGETTAIIVDATTKQERNLHGGLEDYAVARIEYHDGNAVYENAIPEDAIPAEQQSGITAKGNELLDAERIGEVDEQNERATNSALKSVWFTRLPPVVVIYLQRVRYNKKTLKAEKIHDRYDFPAEVAFDRYMEENKEASSKARRKVQGIRKEKKRLLSLLDQYRRFPVETRNEVRDPSCEWPLSSGSAVDTSSGGAPRVEGEFFAAGARMQKRLREALEPSSPLYAVEGLERASIELSLGTIERILDHDRRRCKDFEKQLNSVERESDVYKGLDKVRYLLHAVLVHDGAPESGHYWTFIRNWKSSDKANSWMKLSDSVVSFVSENDMFAWSAGGNGKASAYCLIYTTSRAAGSKELSILTESEGLLPQLRLDEVKESSEAFTKEIEDATKNSNEKQRP